MKTLSVNLSDLDFNPAVGDSVGVRRLISGYGGRKWRLIEADWYCGNIPSAESYTNGYDNKVWRHYGKAKITRICGGRVYFSQPI